MSPPRLLAVTSACILLCLPVVAQAYSGPGVGLGALGVMFGIIGSIFLMTVSLVWYPFKRMIRAMRQRRAQPVAVRDSKA